MPHALARDGTRLYYEEAGHGTPIIFITAYPDETIKGRALSAGALCFLHKPIDLQGRRLVDCLYTALDRGKGTSPVS